MPQNNEILKNQKKCQTTESRTQQKHARNQKKTLREHNQKKQTSDIRKHRIEHFIHAKALGGEEQKPIAEKTQLLNMEEILKQKIQGEIEIKRH